MSRPCAWAARALAAALAAYLMVVGQATSAPAAEGDPLRVLVVGDSISHGSGGDYTWRMRFSRIMAAAGAPVDLMGTRTDLHNEVRKLSDERAGATDGDYRTWAYADPTFIDREHMAQWGSTYRDQRLAVGDAVARTQPAVVLTQLGTNDLTWLGSPEGAMEWVRDYVAAVRRAKPDTAIVLGTVPRRYDSWVGSYVLVEQSATFNALLTGYAAETTTPESSVVVAETASDFDPRVDTYDGTHPGAMGESRIATAMALAMQRLGLAKGVPEVAATYTWDVRAPAPTVTTAPRTATVSWSRESTGASGMYVRVRNVTAGETSTTQLPYAAGLADGDTWTLNGLAGGARYELSLRPAKGTMLGLPGPVTSALVPSAVPLTCTVTMPSRVSITRPVLTLTAGYRPDCAATGATSARWALANSGGTQKATIAYPATSTTATDTAIAAGTYTWKPLGAVNRDRVPLSQNTVATSARFGSSGTLTATRSGSRVTITATASRYMAYLDRYARITPTAQALIQYRLADGSWKTLKYAYPTATKAYVWSYTYSGTRTYRLLLPDASNYWGSASASVTR
ncbi:GDSL-type esterase/lipase family protein [Actinomycetota bacterium]